LFDLALSIQNEILRLIATGIFLMECFFQIEVSARETYLIPFDKEQIQVNKHKFSFFFYKEEFLLSFDFLSRFFIVVCRKIS